jgi:hypothetical protein
MPIHLDQVAALRVDDKPRMKLGIGLDLALHLRPER